MIKVLQFSTLTALLLNTTSVIGADNLKEIFTNIETKGQIRLGVVRSEDNRGGTASTATLGGNLGVKTDPLKGISLGAKFYTTNALFGKDNESMFLGSNNDSYSIVGEAYIQADLGKTSIKVGRQIVDLPYVDSDDIGMIPNTFEGYTLINQDIVDTTIILALLDKWSGVDSDTHEQFNEMQGSGDAVLTAGMIYEGVENTTLQAWHYRFDDADFSYLEAGYETEQFNLGVQYTDQDSDNSAFGVLAGMNFGELALTTAYNKVDGMVTNGFGGGPFFTSSEDHTVAEVVDQDAILIGVEYGINDITLALTHVAFDKGEDETDYLVSYAVNENHSLDLIYSDMYEDGNMVRFFANYNF